VHHASLLLTAAGSSGNTMTTTEEDRHNMKVQLTVVRQDNAYAVIRRIGDGLPVRITWNRTADDAQSIAWQYAIDYSDEGHDVSVTMDFRG